MPNRLQPDGATFSTETSCGVAVVGLDHRLHWVNPAFCKLLGYEPFELIGRTFAEITHPDDVILDVHLAKRVLSGSLASYVFDKRYIDKSGAPVPIHLTASVVRDSNGRAIYGLAVVEPRTSGSFHNPGAGNAQADMDRIRRAILM